MRVREVVLAYPDSRYEKHRRSLSYFVHCTVVSVSLSQADSRGNIFRESCLATRHQTSLAMATRLYLQAWSMKPQAALFISASLLSNSREPLRKVTHVESEGYSYRSHECPKTPKCFRCNLLHFYFPICLFHVYWNAMPSINNYFAL